MSNHIVSVDDNAYGILRKIKEMLRGQGIMASYSDAVRWLFNHVDFSNVFEKESDE